jgi:hypothetical protein
MYQILIKVPVTKYDENGNVTEQQSNPQEVFALAGQLRPNIPEVGQIHISNSEYICFGYVSEDDDSALFGGLPNDVNVVASEMPIEI